MQTFKQELILTPLTTPVGWIWRFIIHGRRIIIFDRKQKKETRNESPFVVDRGIEPLCQDWESCILTIRWIDQHLKERFRREIPRLRKEGDSNPRYGNPYGSLANCWFQPLTHPSLRTLEFETVGLSPWLRVQRYNYFLNPANFSRFFFTLPSFFSFSSFSVGAEYGTRTRDPRLGKPMLYQLS